jgi:hypothetical protein
MKRGPGKNKGKVLKYVLGLPELEQELKRSL